MEGDNHLSNSLDALKSELETFYHHHKLFKDLVVTSIVIALIFLILFIVFLSLFIINFNSSNLFLILSIVSLVAFLIAINASLFFHLFRKYVYLERINNHKKLINVIKQENLINK